MPEIVSFEQFEASIPDYITRAHTAAAKIIELGLASHNSDIEVEATIRNLDAPNFEEKVSDPNHLQSLWETRRNLQSFQADIALGSRKRLALDGVPNTSDEPENRVVRAWVYKTSEADDGKTGWITSATRNYLGNLVMPGYVFPAKDDFSSFPDLPDLKMGPKLYSYVHTQNNARAGRFIFQGANGVGNTPIDAIRNAVAPTWTDKDLQLLKMPDVYTFEAHKIEELLNIMEQIAQSDA